MNKNFYWRSLLLFFFLTILPRSAGADIQASLQHLVQRGPAQTLELAAHGLSAADVDALILDGYTRRGFAPYWIESGQPTERGEVVRAFLDAAGAEGLRPEDYYTREIARYWDSRIPEDLARLDILLTVGLGKYVADLREGRLTPRQFNSTLFASAQDVDVDVVTIIEQAFRTTHLRRYLREQAPQNHQYQRLKRLLSLLRIRAQRGGWPTVSPGETLQEGMVEFRVAQVRRYLTVVGDLTQVPIASPSLFSPELVLAVEHFQERHGLKVDGKVGPATLRAMSVPIESRIAQVELNMERWRWNARDLGGKHIVVNIASFLAGATVNERVELVMPAIVGKLNQETPIFSDVIEYVEFNPYWNIPASIVRNEFLPKLRRNSRALDGKGIQILRTWGDEGSALNPHTVDWHSISSSQAARFHFRQEPGPKNALGRVKIMFPNKHNVYLHDTPTDSLFSRVERTFSHGCIRLARPLEMAAYVLGGSAEGWTLERAQRIVSSKERNVVKLKEPLPVHITYRTVIIRDDGTVRFYNDVYGRDKKLAAALGMKLSPA